MRLIKNIIKILDYLKILSETRKLFIHSFQLSAYLVGYSYLYPNVFDFIWVNTFLLLCFLLQLWFELTPRTNKSFIPGFFWTLLLIIHAILFLRFILAVPEQAEFDSWVKKLLALIGKSGFALIFLPAINFYLGVIFFFLVVLEIYYFLSNTAINNTDINIVLVIITIFLYVFFLL